MKKFHNPFNRYAKGGIKDVKAPVLGITAGEYICIQQSIENAYDAAAKRQKPGAKEPSAYMKGLQTALGLLHAYVPHEMEVQK